jgi:hypothetical protein
MWTGELQSPEENIKEKTMSTSHDRFGIQVECLESRTLFSAASFVSQLATASSMTVSTVPANGDLNPYGVAFVPPNFPAGGPLHPGNLLVSNYNASSNLQGTGSTIVRVKPNGKVSTFFQGPPGLGLTTALEVLQDGLVVVGSLPTTDGTFATTQQGSLIILDKFGVQVADFSNAVSLDGPWDMTVNDEGSHVQLFIADALSGTVSRINLHITGPDSIVVKNVAQIASGYTHRGDPNSLVFGPTGLVYNSNKDTLYVASTADEAVFAVPDAGHTLQDNGAGTMIYSDPTHLHGPLGLVQAPNGHLIVADGDGLNADPNQPSELVEFTVKGQFVDQFSTDTMEAANFGIAISTDSGKTLFASVNDDTNSVTIWTLE